MNYYSDVTTYRFYNKRHQLVQRASIIVICFTLFRNVRPCTILGCTLTNIPQKFNTDKKQQNKTSTKLRAVIEEGPCTLLKCQFADRQLLLVNTARSLKFLEDYTDHQAQIWKIFQKHQIIPDDIQYLHFHIDNFKNSIEKEFALFKEATRKNIEIFNHLSISSRRTPHLYAHMWTIYITNWWNYSSNFIIPTHI